MRTPLSYSSLLNRARPIPLTFCTEEHVEQNSGRLRTAIAHRKPAAGLVTPRSKSPAPIAAPASSLLQHPRNPDATLRSTPLPPATPHSHVPASIGIRDAVGSVVPAMPLWSLDPAEFCPALPPSAFPAWHRSATTDPAEINPIPHAALAAPATPQTVPAPAPTATGRWSFPALHSPPPPAAPNAGCPSLPALTAHAVPNGFRSETRRSPNSDTATDGNTPTPPP